MGGKKAIAEAAIPIITSGIGKYGVAVTLVT